MNHTKTESREGAHTGRTHEDDSEERSSGQPPARVAARFWHFLGKHKRLINVTILGNLTTVTLVLTTPLITKLIIDEAIPSKNLPLLLSLAGAYLALQAMRLCIGYGHEFLTNYIGQRTVFDIRRALFHHLQLLHLSFYEKERTASLVNRVIHDAMTIQQFVNTSFSTLANSLVSVVLGLCIMFVLNVPMTLFCIGALPLYFLVIHTFRKQLRRKGHEVKERQSQLAGALGETFSGIRVVKSFAQEDHERRRFVLRIKDNFSSELELPLMGSRMRISLNILSILMQATIWIWGAVSVFKGTMSIGGFVAYSTYLLMLFAPIENLSGLLVSWTNARTGFERILKLMDIKPKVAEHGNPVEVREVEGHVEFRDVCFSYDGKPAIRNFSLDVKPGEVIAIVGHSGCGKSTLMSLLTRFYDVDSGGIFVDGVDLRHYKYDLYRHQLGIVLQENYLFSGTVEENIRYGRPEASDEEVREAARLANALEFIETIPGGFQGQIGQAGVTLSGGQRQRMAIARTILKNPRILIFDEATSALDNRSEALIQQSLDILMKGKTVFIVAHRLSTIVKADRIVMMSAGRIIEMGTHTELLARKGEYSKLYHPKAVSPAQEESPAATAQA